MTEPVGFTSSLVALLLVIAGCAREAGTGGGGGGTGSSASSRPEPSRYATGTISIETPGTRPLPVEVDDCWSGQMFSFYGVEVFENPNVDARLRVVEDPVEGTKVVLIGLVPGHDRLVVTRGDCTTFESRIEASGNILNDIRSVQGSLELACTLPDGAGRLSARVRLKDCSFDNRAKRP